VRALLRAAGGALAAAILLLLSAAAALLAPWGTGRLLRTVSLPRFREHRLRTSLTVLGVALGVGVLVSVQLVDRSIVKSFAATIDDISGKVDLEVTSAIGAFDESKYDDVKAIPGVYKAVPVLQETAPMRLPGVKNERVLVLGVDFLGGDDDYFRTYESKEMDEIKRDPIVFLNSKTNIIVSRDLARRFGLKLHDRLPLVTPSGVKEFDIWGFVEPKAVGRAFGGAVAVMYYGSMQAAFDHGDSTTGSTSRSRRARRPRPSRGRATS
jgi:putative ABC transport system permease protein